MELILPRKITDLLRRELRGRRNEIGGVIVAEHVGGETFRIVELSVQRSGGTTMHFIRDPKQSKAFLSDFFARTGGNYRRFNYIGEWHSHPTFEPVPSRNDIQAMYQIVEDPEVGANFAVLIIVRLFFRRSLKMSATLFRAGLPPERVVVLLERKTPGLLSRLRSLFKK
ncbi:Mov34/MPN/PAD-1 family protein [Bradyrhizobium xenonodulans]|uniref:Mov34/MPN/PAD-1 family protein n=1 Tax=Bradyrhizobium xenonodulans TaxID=2736875 RepID=A0ABY7MGS7_9BRAD|nr:Mov34/MPN/PAD-1 family protein [Bradyrhizobium xenonodulans]WBL77633.1 Mov34/MPN/PAD-1 family protein [Bradyrhizobium xenonodulans]